MAIGTVNSNGIAKTWLGILIIGVISIYLGVSLADNNFLILLAILATAWVLSIPKHAILSVYLSVATFRAAFIVPLSSASPYAWELAALLGWTGIAAILTMKQYGPIQIKRLLSNKTMIMGLVGYCATLIVLMIARGTGLNILGSDKIGGRYYFQQLSCSILPILFILMPVRAKTLTVLVYVQFLLAITYIIPDLIFTLRLRPLYPLLYFLEVPGDAYHFAASGMSFGFQRYQSLGWAAVGVALFLLSRFRLDQLFSFRRIHYALLGAVVIAVGLLSGQRIIFLILGLTSLFCAYFQHAYTVRNVGVVLGVTAVTLILAYATSLQLPVAVQRAISFLPGIEISRMAEEDATGTLITRKVLREIGWQQVPRYIWLGRGFGQEANADLSERWDPTSITRHLNEGRYYNGFIGLLVNTGLAGFLFMSVFLIGILKVVIRTGHILRTHGCRDRLSLVVCVVNSLFITNVITFLFFHGDSEYAMKTFSLQAGLILACYYHLEERYKIKEMQSVPEQPVFDAVAA